MCVIGDCGGSHDAQSSTYEYVNWALFFVIDGFRGNVTVAKEGENEWRG
jgi:hypothetical protein